MIYKYKNEYYIKMAHKFVKVIASLDINGDVDFKATNEVIDISGISNISDYQEVTLNDVKKGFDKKPVIKEEKEETSFKKISKFGKNI